MLWRPPGLIQAGRGRRINWGAAAGGAFTPADLPNLIAWYDANVGAFSDYLDSVAAINNAVVARWLDQSGTGNHLTENSLGRGPVYKTSGINSKPSMLWNGTPYGMKTAAYSMNTNIHSFFAVILVPSGTDDDGRVAGYGDTSDHNATNKVIWLNTGNGIHISYANNAQRGSNITTVDDTAYRVGVIYDGTNVTTYVNNVGTTPTAYNQTLGTTFTITIGAVNVSTSIFDGYMAEIIITKSALDSGERADLDAYLAAKWGF